MQRVKPDILVLALSCLVTFLFIPPITNVLATQPVIIVKTTALDNYLYVAMQDEPKSLNPVIPNDEWSSKFLDRIWDRTAQRDPDDGMIYPYIATDWKMVDGTNRNFTVHYRLAPYTYYKNDTGSLINKPIKFHDGHQVDIYDLLFSFELAMKVPRWTSDYESLDKTPNGTVIPPEGDASHAIHLVRGISMDADPNLKGYTLHFFMNRTDAYWESNYVGMVLYPYHLWKDKSYSGQFNTWNIENEANPNQYEVGSSAFKFNQWKKGGQYAQLDTFKDYFPWNKMPRNKSGNVPAAYVGKNWHWEVKQSPADVDPHQQSWGQKQSIPFIDGIKFKIYYSVDAAMIALKKGEVDICWWPVDPGYLPSLQGKMELQLVSIPETTFYYTGFNMRKASLGYDDWNSAGRVDKGKILRRVVAMCTDKEAIVKRLLMGYGEAGTSVVSPGNVEYYNSSVKTYPFDPIGAERILNNSGYKKIGGWFDLGPPIGTSQFEYIHSTKDYSDIRYESARMIVDQLRAIGINVISKPMQFGQIIDEINARNLSLFEMGFRVGLEPDYLYDLFHSSQAGIGLTNFVGYHNDSYDKVIEAARAELNHPKKVELVKYAQGIISEDLPVDVQYYRNVTEVYNKTRWVGWIKMFDGVLNDWTFKLLRKPKEYMNGKIEAPKIVLLESFVPINVKVTSYNNGTLLSGVKVQINLSSTTGKDPGRLCDIQNNPITIAITNTNGVAPFYYKAPTLNSTETNRTVLLLATTYKDGYEDSTCHNSMSVLGGDKWLRATFDKTSSTRTIRIGDIGTLHLDVIDETRNAVSNARVDFSVEPATGITLSKISAFTDASGKISLTYTATINGTYKITAEIKNTSLLAISDDITITVLPKSNEPTDVGMPTWMYVGIPLLIIVAIIIFVIIIKRRIKRKIK